MATKKTKVPLDSGEYKVGYKKPPQSKASKKTRYGGEKENPRGHGFFKAEDTARAKLEKIITLSKKELQQIKKDENAPKFERDIAEILLDGSLKPAEKWRIIREIIDEIYGFPKQSVETMEVEPPAPRLAKDRSERQ